MAFHRVLNAKVSRQGNKQKKGARKKTQRNPKAEHNLPPSGGEVVNRASKLERARQMGKKKSRRGDIDDDEARSIGTDLSGPASSAADDLEETAAPEDKFGDLADEQLSAKRAETRVAALGELRALLTMRPDLEPAFEKYALTLAMNVARCAKQGKEDEQAAALLVGALAAVMFGHTNLEVVRDVAKMAVVVHKDKKATNKTKILAIRALCACVAADPYVEVDGDLFDAAGFFFSIWTCVPDTKNAELLTEALTAWTFCLTIPPRSSMYVVDALEQLNELAEGTDAHEVSCPALEAIGLAFEVAREKNIALPIEEDEVETTLATLLAGNNKTVTKNQRKNKKELARRVQFTVVDREAPHEKMTVAGQSLDFEGWAQILQLEFLRGLLLSGLTLHMVSTETVKTLLNLGDVAFDQPRKSKKDVIKTAGSRAKAKTIRDHRSSAAAAAAVFDNYD
ncbi:Interferonrelated developmental regulator 1 [Diplonema papillatum]|nr:Interferonrelated developmental regulator 1 [Diplonema papillatum]KAJ9449177.1 Interferonrelated developmental regulator 1 [Diplonema papillatum]